jgi:hypothetical protein
MRIPRGGPNVWFGVSWACSFLAFGAARSGTSSWSVNLPLQLARGGALKTTTSTANSKDDVSAYRTRQQLYLQSRSLLLRQALIGRGLDALDHDAGGGDEGGAKKRAKPVDWDCAVATEAHPKSCLYSFDAETGAKVLAPLDTTHWITLAALNRLRRTDPTKVEPLWHSQYNILSTWWHPSHVFSLYTYLTPLGAFVSFLLDSPLLLASTLLGFVLLSALVTLPVWEHLAQIIVTHPVIWQQWPSWGRFVHAALPLKLLLGQMAWKAVAQVFGRLYGRVRTHLIDWECQILETCIPVTILEDAEDEDDEEYASINVQLFDDDEFDYGDGEESDEFDDQ